MSVLSYSQDRFMWPTTSLVLESICDRLTRTENPALSAQLFLHLYGLFEQAWLGNCHLSLGIWNLMNYAFGVIH